MSQLALDFEYNQHVQDNSVLVIIGNPPYQANSTNYNPKIKKLIEDYKFVNGQPLNEKNCKSLQDDYVKFIRFAQSKVDECEAGVVAVVTNHGFLDNPTFRGMRTSLLKSFDQIYIVNLHGNSKKKEVCPDGSKDENVFEIQAGVSISFFIKKPSLERKVFYTDLWGLREKKFQDLMQLNIKNIEWKEANPEAPFYLFAQKTNRNAYYDSGFSIKDIFKVYSSGIITARDHLCIDFDAETLLKRIIDFANLSPQEAREKYNLGKCSRDWSIERAQANIKEVLNKKQNINHIAYRPFDNRKVFYTNKSSGFIRAPRYDIMKYMLEIDNIALLFNRSDRGSIEYNHIFSSSSLIDHNIQSGTGNVAPLYLYEDWPIQDIAYRPFDNRKIYYHKGWLHRTFYNTMKHMLANENIGLVSRRQSPSRNIYEYSFITNNIISDGLIQADNKGGESIFPLYLYEDLPVKDIAYWPFDNRKIYLDPSIVFRDRKKVMKHMLEGENVGLVVSRQIAENKFNHSFISNNVVDNRITLSNRGTAFLFLLFLDNVSLINMYENKTENFLPEFRKWIDGYYNHHYKPEEILGYIYGILHSETYRTKYLEFLKMDFPRIQFVKSRELFDKMSALGWELIQKHLMKEIPQYELGYFVGLGNNKVEKVNYNNETKKLYINSKQCFENVSKEVWEFYIGGYQVLSKYLKSRKGRVLSAEEIQNIQNIVNVLTFTIIQMQKIDEVYKHIDS